MKPDLNNLRTLCLFCDPSGHGQANQILLRSDNFYVFAGLGAIIEGYLIITPYTCQASGGLSTSISEISHDLLDELVYLRGMVSAFYMETYGQPGLSFEHGRAGGCTRSNEDTKHCYHPHLCCYPGVINEGTGYRNREGQLTYLWDYIVLPNLRTCNGVHTIKATVGTLPYLYIEHYGSHEEGSKSGMPTESGVYIVPNEDMLDSQFLRRNLAELVEDEEKWDWATFPTRDRVNRVVEAFTLWLRGHGTGYGVGFVEGEPPRINFEGSVRMLTAQAYERIAGRFKERWQGTLQYNTVGQFLSHIPSDVSGGTSKTIRVIDIGCGPGLYSKVFTNLGFECVAVDFSETMLQEAKHYLTDYHNIDAVTFVKASVGELASVMDGTFEAIWFSAVLLHIPRREVRAVLHVLSTLLADHGVLYVSTRLLYTEDGTDYPALEIRPEGRVFIYYGQDELEKLFSDASFRILQSWSGITTVGTLGEKNKKPWQHYLLGKS